MTAVVLVNPTTLVGKELREELERRRELWSELRLVSRDDEEVGTLTEIAGAAAMVGRAEAADLDGAGLVFFCGDREASLPLLAAVPAGAVAVVLAADATVDDGLPLVAGINLEALDGAPPGRPLLSPHPGAILLAHLLHPLREFGLEEAVATLVQPASMYGTPGLDELYAQARRIIAIAGQEPAEVLPGQLAFNLFPSHLPGGHLGAEVAAVLGEGGVEPAVEVVQGAVFHSFAAALYVRCRARPEAEELRQALGEHPWNRLAEDAELLGPVDAAASAEVVVGPVRGEAAGRGFWIWGVMDNLTRGGALNALQIAERALGRGGS
jgi:aspartate-semialdehyde dehydrogenase